MAYFAAALARTAEGWTGSELELDDVEDLDTVADMLRELPGAEPGATVLLFVEQDDEWFGIVRVDGDADPRVFLSDSRAVEDSAVAALLYQEAALVEVGEEEDEEDEEESIRPAAEPTGDSDLLADLGTPSADLLELCAEEGQLPGDIIAAVCEKAGCSEELERLREG